MKLYVRKLWTLNPDKHKKVELWKAITQYEEYIKYYVCNIQRFDKHFKSFKEWLKTEI